MISMVLVVLLWIGFHWIGLVCFGLHLIGLHRIGLHWVPLAWIAIGCFWVVGWLGGWLVGFALAYWGLGVWVAGCLNGSVPERLSVWQNWRPGA